MKIKKIAYNKKNNPSKVTVQMSTTEAALISCLAGHIPPIDFGHISPDTAEVASGIYESLVGECFNRHWDNGLREFTGALGWRTPTWRLTNMERTRDLEKALDAMLADTGIEEDGSYVFESARRAERLLEERRI